MKKTHADYLLWLSGHGSALARQRHCECYCRIAVGACVIQNLEQETHSPAISVAECERQGHLFHTLLVADSSSRR